MTGNAGLNGGVEVVITEEAAAQPKLSIDASRQFVHWLVEHRLSLAFTTYQSGKLFFIGIKPDGKLWVHERTFNRCMGLAGDSQTCRHLKRPAPHRETCGS